MKTQLFLMTTALCLLLSIPASAQIDPSSNMSIEARMGPRSPKRPMTLAIAKRIAAAASKVACQYPKTAPECAGAQAVVDDTGALIHLETLDGTQSSSIDMAIKKAKTAAAYHRPTELFHDAITKGSNMSYLDGSFPDMTTAVGGIPLSANGVLVGAFGTSGNPYVEPVAKAAEEEMKKIVAEGLIK